MNISFDFFFGIPGDLDDAAVEVIHEGVGRKHEWWGGLTIVGGRGRGPRRGAPHLNVPLLLCSCCVGEESKR
jgi:hypothetical protein